MSLWESRARQRRRTGALVCAFSGLASLAALEGVRRRSYWALALPVAAALGLVLGSAFWVGWTLAFTRIDAREEELE